MIFKCLPFVIFMVLLFIWTCSDHNHGTGGGVPCKTAWKTFRANLNKARYWSKTQSRQRAVSSIWWNVCRPNTDHFVFLSVVINNTLECFELFLNTMVPCSVYKPIFLPWRVQNYWMILNVVEFIKKSIILYVFQYVEVNWTISKVPHKTKRV